MTQKCWFTPEGIEDLLPEQAKLLEYTRRTLLDGFDASGYDLVLPPVAEFTDSLLTGTGQQLETDTCRFTDQESGKMMGVRADMTPQVARIMANNFGQEDGIVRLCYVGEVLKSRNNKAKGSRSPIQIGAELFGDSTAQSDIEVVELMLSSLSSVGIERLNLSLGHVAIVNKLMDAAKLTAAQKTDLVDILQRKAVPEYVDMIAKMQTSDDIKAVFEKFIGLAGEATTVLDQARSFLIATGLDVSEELAGLTRLVSFIQSNFASVQIHLDLSDLRGYGYHTGVIFSCYSIGKKLYPIARGGRYDGIAASFGSQNPATGFSLDLRNALDMLNQNLVKTKQKIFVPTVEDVDLAQKIKQLKADGYRVIRQLPNSSVPKGAKTLVKQGSEWTLVSATK